MGNIFQGHRNAFSNSPTLTKRLSQMGNAKTNCNTNSTYTACETGCKLFNNSLTFAKRTCRTFVPYNMGNAKTLCKTEIDDICVKNP